MSIASTNFTGSYAADYFVPVYITMTSGDTDSQPIWTSSKIYYYPRDIYDYPKDQVYPQCYGTYPSAIIWGNEEVEVEAEKKHVEKTYRRKLKFQKE